MRRINMINITIDGKFTCILGMAKNLSDDWIRRFNKTIKEFTDDYDRITIAFDYDKFEEYSRDWFSDPEIIAQYFAELLECENDLALLKAIEINVDDYLDANLMWNIVKEMSEEAEAYLTEKYENDVCY